MRDEATEIMGYLARTYFDNRCFVTHEKFRDRGFVIHHLKYIENDAIRGNYPNGEKGRQDYIKALRPMVEAEPFRFMGLKNGVHTKMDHVRNGITRMKKENQMRLFIACLLTKKTPRKTHKKVKSFTRYKK